MVTNASLEFIVQANFPASKEGSEVEFRILQIGVTGEPVVHQGYDTAGVIDLGKGAYGTTLTLAQGFYSIEWHIKDTNFYANEEIDVRENIYDVINNISVSANYRGLGL